MTPRLAAMLGLRCLALYLLLFYLPQQVYNHVTLGVGTISIAPAGDVDAAWLLVSILAVKHLLVLTVALIMWFGTQAVSGLLIEGEATATETPHYRYGLRAACLFAGLILLLQAMASWAFVIRSIFANPSLFVFYIVAAVLLIFDAKVLLAAAKRVVTTNWWAVLMRLRARQQQRQD